MQALLFAFSSGAFSSAWWPVLLPPWMLICLISLCLPFLAWRSCQPSLLSVFPGALIALFVGMLWAAVWGQEALEHQLPKALDKTDYRVRGVIVGLPDRNARRIKFQLKVHDVEMLGENSTTLASDAEFKGTSLKTPSLKTLSLSWYGGDALIPGQEWQFVVRLRHPRGFANPGGFDYRAWLFRNGISATGYVRKSPDNVRRDETNNNSIDSFRYRIAQRIEQLPLSVPARGLLRALTIGDKSGISTSSWQSLQRTGTVHLAVISGLHIGLAALLGTLLGGGLGRLLALGGVNLLPRQMGVLLGWVIGFIYAGLAGFSLPTLRAFVMLSVFVLMFLLRRNTSPFTSLLWAWTVVSVMEPLAMLSPGFWLSFLAVAILIVGFRGRSEPSNVLGSSSLGDTSLGSRTSRNRSRGKLRVVQFVQTQWLLLLGLSGCLVFFIGELSLIMPLVNLLAVPWLGFLVVPLCLLGVGLFGFYEPGALFCWQLAGRQLEWFSAAINWLSVHDNLIWIPGFAGGWLVMLALVCAGLLLLSPRGLRLRALGVLIICGVVFAEGGRDQRIPLAMTVLDVGQGLALVVETREGVLVYDVGSSFSDRFDAGSGIVAPYLRHRGYRDLRMLVVSHSDQDHSGGVEGLLRYYLPEVSLFGSFEGGQAMHRQLDRQLCQRGMSWQWGEVGFQVLHPQAHASISNRGSVRKRPQNNNSCVVAIRYRDQSILLTGDIEKTVERQLLANADLPDKLTVLLAPHHGSKTSSSAAFVKRLAPQHVVFSAGYNHHFGHPHRTVVSRYTAVGSRQWNTAAAGALRFAWDVDGELLITPTRGGNRHYW